jgi:hypothetical protein
MSDFMQRLCCSCGQRQNSYMKYLYPLSLLLLLVAPACKKDKHQDQLVTVTIQEKGPFNANSYAATVENANPAVYSFLCNLPAGQFKPIYSCSDAIYITNLPANLRVPGKKITFTGWKDSGQPAPFSSINNAHELEVYNAKEVD